MKKKPVPAGTSKIDPTDIASPSSEKERILVEQVARLTAHLEAETAAHQRSEADKFLLSSIVESSNDAIISISLDGVITSWNDGAERHFGYTADEAIGQPIMMLIPSELEIEEPGILDRIRHGETLGHYETVRRRKDGTRVEVSLTVSPIFDAQGRIVGASKVARDITERKRAEEALRASEERFRAAAGAVSDMIWTNNPGGEMQGEQSVWGAFTGQSQKDYEGYGWTNAVHPEDTQPTLDAWNHAVAENRKFEFEHRVRRHDGEWRLCSVLAVPVPDSQGGIREWVGVHTDISESKQAEDMLRESQQFTRRVLDNLFAFVGVLTTDGTLTDANRAPLEAAGIPASEVLGKKFWDCYWWNYSAEIQSQLRIACERAASGEIVRYDVPVRMAGDTRVWIDFQIAPLRDTEGQITHLIPSAMEIDVRRAAEEKLRASENLKSSILDSSLDAIITMDHEGKVLGFNAAAERTFGFRQADVLGEALAEKIIPERLREQHYQGLAHYLASGEGPVLSRRVEVPALHADGHEFDIELSINRIANIEPPLFTATMRDITKRKQAEEVQARMGAIVSSADDGILSKALDGVVTTWNASAERLFGYTAEEIIGNPNLHLTPPDLFHEEELILKQILSGKAVEHFETHRLTKDGRRLPVSLTISPIKDATGKIVGASKIVRDITERMRAEEALRDSQERFRAAAGAVSDIIWTNNAGGEMDGEQPGWSAFTGQRREEYQGYGWSDALHPEDAQPTIAAWNLALEEKRTFEFEHRVRRHDGEWRLCSTRAVPVLDSKGEIREWVGVHTDITERKQAETNLRESETRMRLATEATAVGIWEWNVLTNAIRWDAQMFRLYGIQPTADCFVHYSDWSGAVVPEYLSETERILQDTVRRCGQGFLEFPIRRRDDGECRTIEAALTVITNEQGQAEWVLGTNLDVTERKRVQDALIEAKEHAEAASRAKDEFLATLSHELRTPLTPVLMAATALASDPSLPVEARQQLDMMRRNIELEARLIDDLLDLTRIIHGKLIIAPVSADIHELLHHTEEIIRSDDMGKQLHIVMKLDAARHHALADPARIQQVFWNLLRNAVKFTPGGGSITVNTRNDAEGRIIISVADSGIGIRAEVLAQIFNAFEQGDTSGEHRYGGLGLGLAISSAIVTAHGGQIRADSAGRGHGAEFTVTLGNVPAPAATIGNDSPQAQVTRSLSLLIVEDHESSRMVLEHFLTLGGHRITTASTVNEALAAYKAGHFDAVISDLGLPDGSGIDLMVQIQSIRPVPAIALSGYGMERDLQRTKDAGFSAHLVKPVKLDQLKRLLAEVAAQDGHDLTRTSSEH